MNNSHNPWIQRIKSLVLQAQENPMWGTIPPFPWDQFAKELGTTLEIENFSITAGNADWKKEKSLLTGIGGNPFHVSIELSPLEGELSLVFSTEDFAKFASWTMGSEVKTCALTDPSLQQGFFRYLILEGMRIFENLKVFGDLTPKLVTKPLVREEAYSIDFSLHREEETAWGRLLCSPSFQQAFKSHFSNTYRLSIPSHLYRDIFLNLHLYAGSTTLNEKAWKEVNIGDFILLDHCSYFPHTKKGTFQLTLNQTPLFQVKLKEDKIKILDYALYYEEGKMEDTPDEELFNEDGSIDETNDLSDELEDSSDQVIFDEDVDLSDEMEDLGDTFPDEASPLSEDEKPKDQMEEESSDSIETSQATELIAPDQVSLAFSVEVARLNMNLDKLLTLKPGNVLTLSVHPELSVNLVSNGQTVARGQLIQIGDVVGVKITEIGS